MNLSQYVGMIGVIAGLYGFILGVYGIWAGAKFKRDRCMRLLTGGFGLLLAGVDRLTEMNWLGLVGWLLIAVAILYPQIGSRNSDLTRR